MSFHFARRCRRHGCRQANDPRSAKEPPSTHLCGAKYRSPAHLAHLASDEPRDNSRQDLAKMCVSCSHILARRDLVWPAGFESIKQRPGSLCGPKCSLACSSDGRPATSRLDCFRSCCRCRCRCRIAPSQSRDAADDEPAAGRSVGRSSNRDIFPPAGLVYVNLN